MTFGGAETAGLVGAVLQALRDVAPRLHIRCILGALAGQVAGLEKIRARSPHRVEILRNVRDMSAVMRWADLAVGAAGSTAWEFCATGVPMILTALAENQRGIAEALAARGGAVWGGGLAGGCSPAEWRELFLAVGCNPGRRVGMTRRAHKLVGGGGAIRVVKWLMRNDGGIGIPPQRSAGGQA